MNPKSFLELKARLLERAEDVNSHLLDRVDAYLELSQMFQRDDHARVGYVTKARDLIRDEMNS